MSSWRGLKRISSTSRFGKIPINRSSASKTFGVVGQFLGMKSLRLAFSTSVLAHGIPQRLKSSANRAFEGDLSSVTRPAFLCLKAEHRLCRNLLKAPSSLCKYLPISLLSPDLGSIKFANASKSERLSDN